MMRLPQFITELDIQRTTVCSCVLSHYASTGEAAIALHAHAECRESQAGPHAWEALALAINPRDTKPAFTLTLN